MSILIGIAGGSGSGKSTLAKNLAKAIPDSALIAQDNYYRSDIEWTKDFNYDHPSAFDTELFISHLDSLLSGEDVKSPVYDYSTHKRKSETKTVASAKVIIAEGILVLENEEVRRRADLKIFVDTSEEDRLARRIERDTAERGRSKESVIDQFESAVKPMHELYVEPEKQFSDIIIKNGGEDPEAIAQILSAIEELLSSGATK